MEYYTRLKHPPNETPRVDTCAYALVKVNLKTFFLLLLLCFFLVFLSVNWLKKFRNSCGRMCLQLQVFCNLIGYHYLKQNNHIFLSSQNVCYSSICGQIQSILRN